LQAAGLPKSSASKSVYSRYLEGLPDYEVEKEDGFQELPSPFEPHPSLSIPVNDPPARTAAEAWTLAKSVLESQLDPDLFLKYLSGSLLARYDSASNTFTVAVEDPYHCAWLQQRLARLIGRMLNGITGRPANVLFTTFDQVDEA
jgi:hypothetical protein